MAQYMRPISDHHAGGWTPFPTSPTTLYDKIDEAISDDDSTYINADENGSHCAYKLDSVTDPGVSTGHILHVLFRSQGSDLAEKLDVKLVYDYGGPGQNFFVDLQNQTNRSDNYLDVNYTLSEAEADAILDYSKVYIHLTEDGVESGEWIRVTQAYLEVPDAGGVTLVVADGVHDHLTDNIDLTQAHILAIAEVLHSHLSDSIDLTQAHLLAIADALHAHMVDPIILSQAHQLAISDGGHDHLADNITLDVAIMLIIQDALHGISADGITLSQVHQLLINNAAHGHTVDPILLSQVHNLAVNDTLHDHLADNIDLFIGVLLVIADTLHGHAAENITLSQVHNLLINAGLHTLASDPITLTQVHNLIVAGGLHEHLADNIDLILEGIEYAKMGSRPLEKEDVVLIGSKDSVFIGEKGIILISEDEN